MLTVAPADPRAPGPRALLEASHALMRALFPPEDNYFLDIDALCEKSVHFFVARNGERTLGTGALAVREGYGEVKSMFTTPEARGKGVGDALLRALEAKARELGLGHLRLETAETLDSAIRLYERNGFKRRGIFGTYRPNKTSVFMEKTLVD